MKKRFTAFILMLAMILSMQVFVFADNGEVVIIHTTDIHSRNDGFAALGKLVDDYRAADNNVLVLDSGDLFHGLPFSNLERGKSIADIAKLIGYDAMTTGNHDYNFGLERLIELGKIAEMDILCANAVDDNGKLLFDPYHIFECGGMKIGIIGLANSATKLKTRPENTEGITFINPIEAAKSVLPEVKEKSDFVIALTHMGSIKESEETSIELGEAVDGIDLILDGHSHNLNAGIKAGNATLVSSGNYLKTVSVITISKNGTISAEQKEITDTMEKKPEITELISSINDEQSPLLSEVIGKTNVFLNGEYPIVRSSETNLGKIIADSYRYITDSDLAVENGGGIRKSIVPGNITKGDIYSVQPFGNFIIKKELTGAEFKQLIKNTLPDAKTFGGSFLQVSGAVIEYDGDEIISIKINGEDMADDKSYTIATNNYIATSFDIIKDAKTLGEFCATDEAIIEYITSTPDFISENTYLVDRSKPSEYRVLVDGYQSEISTEDSNAIPFRGVFELLKYDVSWNAETETATAVSGDKKISVQIGKDASLSNGRTMLDKTVVSNLTGRTVYVDEESKAIILW